MSANISQFSNPRKRLAKTVAGNATRVSEAGVNFDETNIEQDENEAFNAEIDSKFGKFRIGGLQYRASEVLYSVDYSAYLEMQEEYRSRWIAETKQLVMYRFPTLIAHNFRRMEVGSLTYHERLSRLRDVWDTVIYFLYALAVSEIRAAGHAFISTRFSPERIRTEKIATKMEVLSDLVEYALVLRHSGCDGIETCQRRACLRDPESPIHRRFRHVARRFPTRHFFS